MHSYQSLSYSKVADGARAAASCAGYSGFRAAATPLNFASGASNLHALWILKTLARWTSIVLHPFASVLVLVAAVESRRGPGIAAQSVLAIALLFVIPLALLAVRQVRRGAWVTVDASRPQERPVLYLVGTIALLAVLAYLSLTQPGSPLILGGFGTLAMFAVCALATRWIKVSLHMAAASLAAAILLRAGIPLGWAFAAALPLLAWSRVTMGRHQWAEVALGCLVGATTGFTIVALS